MSRYQTLREQVYESNLELPRRGLVLYTFGNVSGIDREAGVVAIKPSGVPYETLRPEDIVLVDLENQVVEGTRRPSSDTKTHLLLYRNFTAIGGICHTHSTHAVAWAQAQLPLPLLGTTHADHLTTTVPCTAPMTEAMIRGDYELETGQQILDVFREQRLSPAEVEMVLVASHGPFTWGRDAAKAVYNAAVLEELAHMAWLTLQINPAAPPLSDALISKHYLRKHGKDSYYGQP
ncbi:L-ribulose-5-phosphate 4-epimerase [Hymenobacter sp.]|uniref:L-ribulose-5-phosphate 4-epimerase n=1 Tax=Hymenobacter sp. TaxID=1898978 RepID=UPI00286D1C4C|nr:L-ribulose-5-phosphate 4-epimerase [Hymenobacter sp.]